MPSFKYVIELSEQDRIELFDIVTKGTSSARKILRANILLASDKRSDKYMTVSEIAKTYHTTPTTVQNVRASYCENGLTATINRKKREAPPVPAKVTGEVEAHIIALACSDPPEGYSKWTLRLLADKTVELGYIESISHVTVSSVLKKMNLSLS
ncbi:MAG: helix-turn-helix domain-containing protein [Ruminococcus sp.]|nr:helix-turn-helix domain-containing protein [Ruminococcus sp.]